jgi:predicted NBD/HSP70 family sugar kinase
MTHYLGFDIGGTSIKYGVVTPQGSIVERGSFPTQTSSDDNIAAMLRTAADMQNYYAIKGIGIDAPGIVRADGYMVTGGAIDSFYDFPLGQTIAAQTKLPTRVENDANAAALAEHWLGNARGVANYVMLALGTGIGGGIVINGQVFRGGHGMAGEIGWTVTHQPDWGADLERASLNYSAATVTGLLRKYNASASVATRTAVQETDARVVINKAHAGDPIAAPVYQAFLQDVAIMVLNILATFDPELVLLGGGISANTQFAQDILATVDELITRHESLHRIERVLGNVRMAGLRNDAGLLGAVYPLVQGSKEEA